MFSRTVDAESTTKPHAPILTFPRSGKGRDLVVSLRRTRATHVSSPFRLKSKIQELEKGVFMARVR